MPLPRRSIADLSTAVTAALRQLLEEKHLYQSLRLDLTTFMNCELEHHREVLLPAEAEQIIEGEWVIEDPSYQSHEAYGPPETRLCMAPPHAKLYCSTCERREAFNPLHAHSLLDNLKTLRVLANRSPVLQIFALTMLCQSCKAAPEGFLIRRRGLQLTLCGRAPIEAVEVPAAIPKSVAQYFSSAVVAHQSGQTLAGLFFLRTLIEQWVQKETPAARVDEALEAYVASLPLDFRERFPTLRKLYSDLSDFLHRADGSAELYTSSQKDITLHFEARQLYERSSQSSGSVERVED